MGVIKMNHVSAFLGFCLLVTSCQTSQTAARPASKPHVGPVNQSAKLIEIDKPDTLVFRYTDFTKSAGECDSSLAACAKISLHYPIFSGSGDESSLAALNQFIQQFLLTSSTADSTVYPNPEMFSENFFHEYAEMQSEIPDYVVGWELIRQVQVIYSTSKVTSLRATSYAFTGGAHGNSDVQLTSYWRDSGEPVELNDILIPENQLKLNSIAEAIFRKDKNIRENENLDEAGYWFEKNHFMLNRNFAISETGLLFHFNAYEIAPYSYGGTELMIPFSELSALLRPELQWRVLIQPR